MDYFNIVNVAKTKNFNCVSNKISQEKYYKMNGASSDLLKLIKLNNKSFGEKMQRIIIELLDLGKSSCSSYDAYCNKLNLKFEIKSSRYWVNIHDFRWQHIMLHHNYDFLLLVGIDFDKLKVFILSKKDIIKYYNCNIICMQGGAEGQGLWVQYKKIKNLLHEIKDKQDFYNYLDKI